MRENKVYFKKGFYNHPQVNGFPSLKQFIVLEKAGKRCLLLRFVNETELKIDQMQLVLTQLDASGKVINMSRVRYKDMRFGPETTYVASRAIVVKDECVDFRVEILYVVSGKYKYVRKNGRATATYDTRGYNGAPIMGNSDYVTKVKNVRVSHGVYRFIAFISMVLVILSCCFVFFVKDRDKKNSTVLSENIAEYYIIEA